MKKILLIAMVLIASISLNTLNAQVKGGIKLGVDFSNLVIKVGDQSMNDEYDTKRLISPRLGFILEVPVNDFLFVHTGLFVAAKGFRYDDVNKTKYIELLGTIDVPLNFGYKYDLGNLKLFGMAGPVISYNMYTTSLFKIDGESWDNNNHNTIGTSEDDTYKPLNFGINFEAGVEVSRFQFSAFYTQGMSDLSNSDHSSIKTNVFGLTVAIKFGSVNN